MVDRKAIHSFRHSDLSWFYSAVRLEPRLFDPASVDSSPQISSGLDYPFLQNSNEPSGRPSIMPPAFSHPPGVTFVDDQHTTPLVSSDASIYYGGGEAFSRSRTYSGVSLAALPFHLDHPVLTSDLVPIRTILDLLSRLYHQARSCIRRISAQPHQANVP